MGEVTREISLAERLIGRAREERRRVSVGQAVGRLDPHGALLWLESFLGDPGSTAETPASSLLGRRAARRYARAIAVRHERLAEALGAAALLPVTRLDDEPLAPLGAFAHRLTGDPARLVATWLGLPHGHAEGRTRAALFAYRDALAAADGPSPAELAAGLPGAVCFGVLATLPGFPGAKPRPREATDATTALRESLGCLLDLIDTLTLAAPAGSLLEAARDYAANGRERRARRLLATHLERAPDDAPAALALARIERARGRGERALHVLERARERRPDDAGLARGLARTRTVTDWLDRAEAPGCMPRVALDAHERAAGCFHDDTLAAALELYSRHGTLLVEGAFDPALLESCRAQFLDAYRDYLDDRPHADALRIGDRRFQVSIAIAGAFNDPGFYANPFVLALMHRLLDRQAIVGSTVCATSLPGSSDQHLHKDHRALFTEDAEDEPPALPPVAVTTMIPLVALDEAVGTTLVRKGSHRRSRRASERLPEQAPLCPLGSCFLMDLALSHRGQGNRTERVRPIVNMQYTRRWFVDNKNFRRQRPLEIPRAEYARIPAEHRVLFDWARQPGPRVNR